MTGNIKIVSYSQNLQQATVAFILNILENEFNLKNRARPDIMNISKYYQKDNRDFWLALQDKEIIGSIALKDCGEGRRYLKRMYVAKNKRGKGLAKALCDTLLQFANTRHYKTLYLATLPGMKEAIQFYEKNGFYEIDSLPRDFYPYGDTVFYRKEL